MFEKMTKDELNEDDESCQPETDRRPRRFRNPVEDRCDETLARFAALAAEDSSPVVRLYLPNVMTMPDWPSCTMNAPEASQIIGDRSEILGRVTSSRHSPLDVWQSLAQS